MTSEYKNGRENTASDALSRRFASVFAISAVTPTWIYEVVNSYSADEHTKELVQKFIITPPPSQSDYTFTAGVLRFKGRLVIGRDDKLQASILSSLHQSALGGHSVSWWVARHIHQRWKEVWVRRRWMLARDWATST